MIPAAFDYVRADSADAAVAALTEHGDEAKLLAGGMSLLPLMKLRLAVPSVLVDVGRLDDLPYVRDGGDHLAIGALTRHRDLETDATPRRPSAACCRAVAAEVGDNQVRHRGTIGGSVAHGDPASRPPRGAARARRRRSWSAGPAASATIAGDRLLHRASSRPRSRPTSCSPRSGCPKTGANGFSYQKFNRRAQDWAIVGAVAVRVNGTHARRAREHGRARRCGRRRSRRRSPAARRSADAAAARGRGHRAVGATSTPTAEYREHLARVLTRRALEAAGA